MLRGSDVEEVMTRAKAALARLERSDSESVVVVAPETTDPLGIASLRGPAHLLTEFQSGSARPVIGQMIRFIKRLIRRLLRWWINPIAEQQSRFNNAQLDLVSRLHAEVETLTTTVATLTDSVTRNAKRLDLQHSDITSLSDEVRGPVSASDSTRTELAYKEFEDRHRGSDELIASLLSRYVEAFKGRTRVLDFGCGRGEFLQLLKDAGIGAYGVDLDEGMVEAAKQRGVDAVVADGLAHLAELEDGQLDGLFSSQVAEHLTTAQLMRLIDLASRKVRAGGLVVIETPNPESLFIFHAFFYVDLTHVRPIHPEAMRWALEAHGFEQVSVDRLHPVPEDPALSQLDPEQIDDPRWQTLANNIARINHVVFGPQHYAAFAVSPGRSS